MMCQWIGLALEVLHDAVTSKLCIMGNTSVIPPQVKVSEKGIWDQFCKMDTTNQQDQTALTHSLKGLCMNLWSCELWLPSQLQAGLIRRGG